MLELSGFRRSAGLALGAVLALSAAAPASAQYQYPSSQYPSNRYPPAQTQTARDPAAEAWAQILARYPQSNDAALNQRVRTVGQRLATAAGAGSQSWDYRVLVNDSPNAFVLPGGRVGVNTGLFKIIQNDDQLAAVLGHEIAHNQSNHAAQRQQRTGIAALGLNIASAVFGRNNPQLAQGITRYGSAGAQLGILLPFSRGQELEADRIGVEYMARAGYRPSQAVALWRNLQNSRTSGAAPQFLSTHPNDATRIQQLEAYVRSRGYP